MDESWVRTRPEFDDAREGEQGFLLVGVIVMVALLLLVLSVAAPIVAKDLQREKELEAKHRGEQYVRAIRTYYLKFNAYPTSVKALEKSNNVRYLRQHYLDPMTGKDDWRLIQLGQAKTTVKGFFGEPLAGLATSGLGSASGLQSGGLGGTTGATTGGTGTGVLGAGSTAGTSGTADGGTSTTGGTGTGGTGNGGTGNGGTGTSGFGSSSFGNGATGGSSDATGFSGGGGPFVGVGLPKDSNSIITLNEQTNYSTWEFLYDPRIEQLYAKASIFGGGIATSSGGLGSASGLSSTPGTGTTGTGSGTTGTTGSGGTDSGGTGSGGTGSGGTTTTPPTAPQ